MEASSDSDSEDDFFFQDTPPANLGLLGEEYAQAWLQQQAFVEAKSVRWLNRDHEQQRPYDVEIRLTALSGPCYVEIKTRWRGSKRVVSRAQGARLQDEKENNMLLIVGDMRNLFETPPQPPIIHLLARPAVQGAVQPERPAPAVATEVKPAVVPASTTAPAVPKPPSKPKRSSSRRTVLLRFGNACSK